MKTIKIGKWTLSVDTVGTREAYAGIKCGSPERCGCVYCQNYVGARSIAYPKEAQEIFDLLGIDTNKEAETFHTVQLKSGLQLYGGFFHFIGSVQSTAEATDSHTFFPLNEEFDYLITEETELIEEAFKGKTVLQFEFSTQLPWVIDQEFPGPAEE